ncbi:MAG: response regulator [Rhodospirillales bacterium]|nr:response regulator [Rhodospirillales bacterium]
MSKVLIVDDDEIIRKFLTATFEERGFVVTLAENGGVALKSAKREKPVLIVLDMNMPLVTGWQVARELKRKGESTAAIPIIALTAHKTADDHAEAHEAGCDVFVEKPIKPELLFEAVDRVLG